MKMLKRIIDVAFMKMVYNIMLLRQLLGMSNDDFLIE